MEGHDFILGIIAGGGELPGAIAESVLTNGGKVFVYALQGIAERSEIEHFPHAWGSIGEVGKGVKILRDANVKTVTLAGKVSRPQWNEIKLDMGGAAILPKVIAAAAKGDDALLRLMVEVFEKEGFRVVGTADAAPDLLARRGNLGRRSPNAAQANDIAIGATIVRATGALDVGQAAIVCDGVALAVEAAEGTDAMIARVNELPLTLRGTPKNRRGVLVKASKPHQERRVDLPVIGPGTVTRAAEVGLAGIALEAGRSLIMRRSQCIELADRLGLFLFGFDPPLNSE